MNDTSEKLKIVLRNIRNNVEVEKSLTDLERIIDTYLKDPEENVLYKNVTVGLKQELLDRYSENSVEQFNNGYLLLAFRLTQFGDIELK